MISWIYRVADHHDSIAYSAGFPESAFNSDARSLGTPRQIRSYEPIPATSPRAFTQQQMSCPIQGALNMISQTQSALQQQPLRPVNNDRMMMFPHTGVPPPIAIAPAPYGSYMQSSPQPQSQSSRVLNTGNGLNQFGECSSRGSPTNRQLVKNNTISQTFITTESLDTILLYLTYI